MPAAQAQTPPKLAYTAVFCCPPEDLDLAQTLDCGQAFRWRPCPDGGFMGIAFQKICHISQLDNKFFFSTQGPNDFEDVWRGYFDLGRDYAALKKTLCADPVLARAIRYAPGVRLLRQEPWEALCSFIISQNNNVPRIRGIVERLCALLGDELAPGLFSFPGPERLAPLSPEALSPLRAGFRARYLIDAAQKVLSKQVDLSALSVLPIGEAREMVRQITGVGAKVAECALLYGCGRLECVPVDVWIRRVLDRLYPHGLPACTYGVEGIAQQYLFHYARTCPEALEGD